MRSYLALVLAAWLGGAWFAGEASAHGGTFRGPNGGVPPGLREPHDPEPPPPPPSDPGTPGAPVTPTDPGGGRGPETPSEPGPGTGGAPPVPTPNPLDGTGGAARTSTTSFESWRFWWAYNCDDILNLKTHIYARAPGSSSPFHYVSQQDRGNRRDAERPTRRMIGTVVRAALERCLERPSEHEDVQGGALVALGKTGTSAYLPLFSDAMRGSLRQRTGRTIDLGYQARESGALAFGLLPDLDARDKEAVRRICLEAVADEGLRTRERAWAAVSLGLQQDAEAAGPLLALLGRKYENDNVPAGILCGLGLIGDRSVRAPVEEAFVRGRLHGRDLGDRERAFAGYALAKMADPASLDAVSAVLKSRRYGRLVKRSAAIAAGAIASAPGATDAQREEAVRTLRRYLGSSGGDPSGENFALIALSRIGTASALRHLLEVAENGKYGQRPFAALGLATRVWYLDRDGTPLEADLRARIVDKLRDLSRKFKDTDTRSAFLLSRGLVRDAAAVDELVAVVAKKGDPMLRGFACVALGLLGDAREEVKDALRLALRERTSTDLRRDAATGLGLLRDAEAIPLLLEELERARSFAVQGQLIHAIGTIGDHRAVEPLVRLLDDPRQPAQTRAMAAVGLGMIGDLRELPPLARLSKDYNYRASVPDLDELLYIL